MFNIDGDVTFKRSHLYNNYQKCGKGQHEQYHLYSCVNVDVKDLSATSSTYILQPKPFFTIPLQWAKKKTTVCNGCLLIIKHQEQYILERFSLKQVNLLF